MSLCPLLDLRAIRAKNNRTQHASLISAPSSIRCSVAGSRWVEQSGASVANLEAQPAAQRSRIEQAERQIAEAQATLVYRQQQYGRYQDLARTGVGTQQRAQQAASDLAQGLASVAAAQANAAGVEKQIPVLEAQRAGAIAQLRAMLAGKALAEANLRCGNAAEITAAPQPPNTSQNVPKNSVGRRRCKSLFISALPRFHRLPHSREDRPCPTCIYLQIQASFCDDEDKWSLS